MTEEPTTTTNNYGYPYANGKNGLANPSDYLGQGIRGPLWTLAGTTIGILAAGLIGNNGLFGFGPGPGGPGGPGASPVATQRDLAYERDLTTKDAEIGQLKAQLYTDQQVNELRRELSAATAAQQTFNATTLAAVGTVQAQTQQLLGMTGSYIKQPVMAASEGALNFIPPAVAAAKAATTSAA